MRETDRSGLVQVIQHLAVQPVAVNRDRGEEALLIHKRADEALRLANTELEERVQLRTTELERSRQELQALIQNLHKY